MIYIDNVNIQRVHITNKLLDWFLVCRRKKTGIEIIFMVLIGFIDLFHYVNCFCIYSCSTGFNSKDLEYEWERMGYWKWDMGMSRRLLLNPIKLQYDWVLEFKTQYEQNTWEHFRVFVYVSS